MWYCQADFLLEVTDLMLKYALLGLLSHKAMTGYELEGFITATIAHFWTAKLSQIYRTLKGLEEDGWVSSHVEVQEGKPDKRIYALTNSGRKALSAWQDTLVTELDDLRQPSLVRFFFFGKREPDDVLTQLKVWRDLHSARAHYFREELPKVIQASKDGLTYTERDAFFWEATRKLGEMSEQTYVAWLEEVIQALEKGV